MVKITSKKEYYEALERAKEKEDEVREAFPLAEMMGWYLKELAEFDIKSAGNLAIQILNKIGENYPNIYNIKASDSEYSPTSSEEAEELQRQRNVRSYFINR